MIGVKWSTDNNITLSFGSHSTTSAGFFFLPSFFPFHTNHPPLGYNIGPHVSHDKATRLCPPPPSIVLTSTTPRDFVMTDFSIHSGSGNNLINLWRMLKCSRDDAGHSAAPPKEQRGPCHYTDVPLAPAGSGGRSFPSILVDRKASWRWGPKWDHTREALTFCNYRSTCLVHFAVQNYIYVYKYYYWTRNYKKETGSIVIYFFIN